MAYNILNKLKSEDRLKKCSISIRREDVVNKREFIFGRDITAITRSRIVFAGGETGQEELSIPLESIREISLEGRIVFRKRKRGAERVYPRGPK